MIVMSIGTLICRFSGFIRDAVFARFLGTSPEFAAFIFAFTIPNLFRRLFGEGALNEAFVPYFNDKLEKQGLSKAFEVLNIILSVLLVSLSVISIIAVGICFVLQIIFPDKLTFSLLPILIPYMIFVCGAGFLSGVLNSFEHFALPSYSALILNVLLIAGAFIAPNLTENTTNQVQILSAMVILAGVIQLFLNFPVLAKHGYQFKFKVAFNSLYVKELKVLLIPGLIGAGVYQLSVLTDRVIAYFFLGDAALSSLYYSERLVYLPIGIFAVALGAASLPMMSRAFSAGKEKDMEKALFYSLRHSIFLSMPCVIVFIFAGDLLIKLIFSGGAFDDESFKITYAVLLFYLPGIPAFASMKILRTGFFSRKDMKTPLKISAFCFLVNLILNICLIIPLQEKGLALATVLSSFLNCFLLFYILNKELKMDSDQFRELLMDFLKQAICLSAFALTLYFSLKFIVPLLNVETKIGIFILLSISALVASISMLIIMILLKTKELKEFKSIFIRS